MPKNALVPISAQRASSANIAKQWLVKFAEVTQKPITPALANIWAEQLGDLEPDLLGRACDRLMKKWEIGFLPLPGNVRQEAERIASAELLAREEERRRLEAKARSERAIAWAEHIRQRQLPAPKQEASTAKPKLDLSMTAEPVRVVDFESRCKDLARQAEEVRRKYPATGKDAMAPSE